MNRLLSFLTQETRVYGIVYMNWETWHGFWRDYLDNDKDRVYELWFNEFSVNVFEVSGYVGTLYDLMKCKRMGSLTDRNGWAIALDCMIPTGYARIVAWDREVHKVQL